MLAVPVRCSSRVLSWRVYSTKRTDRQARLTKSARDEQRFTGDPGGIVRSKEDRSGRNVFRLSDATERCLRFKHFPHIALSVTAGYGSFGYHHAWVDGIDADFSRSEFLRQSARDRVHCALRRVVNHRSRRSQGAGKRTDVNDAPAVRIEVLECFLSGKKHSENVHIKKSVNLLLGDVLQRHELINTGVVDQNVDLAQGLLRLGEKSLNF